MSDTVFPVRKHMFTAPQANKTQEDNFLTVLYLFEERREGFRRRVFQTWFRLWFLLCGLHAIRYLTIRSERAIFLNVTICLLGIAIGARMEATLFDFVCQSHKRLHYARDIIAERFLETVDGRVNRVRLEREEREEVQRRSRPHQIFLSPDIMMHVMRSMQEDDTEALYAKGAHLVSWTWNVAFFRHASKNLAPNTIMRYLSSENVLVGPNNERAPRIIVTGNFRIVEICTDLPEYCMALQICSDEFFADAHTILVSGSDSMYTLIANPRMFALVEQRFSHQNITTVRIADCMAQTCPWYHLFAGVTYQNFYDNVFARVRSVYVNNAHSVFYLASVMGMFASAQHLCISMDCDNYDPETVAIGERNIQRVLHMQNVPYRDCMASFNVVRELEVDGRNGVFDGVLRDTCTDWVEKRNDLESLGLPMFTSSNNGILLVEEANSNTFPVFPMCCVEKVCIQGPVWRNFSTCIFMPRVHTVSFESLPFVPDAGINLMSVFTCARKCFPHVRLLKLKVDSADLDALVSCTDAYARMEGTGGIRCKFAAALHYVQAGISFRGTRGGKGGGVNPCTVQISETVAEWMALYHDDELDDPLDRGYIYYSPAVTLKQGGPADRCCSMGSLCLRCGDTEASLHLHMLCRACHDLHRVLPNSDSSDCEDGGPHFPGMWG